LPNTKSRIIQIAEDLGESAYQLSPLSANAINGCWERSLYEVVKKMVISNTLSEDMGKELLLTDNRFDKQGYTGSKTVGEDVISACVTVHRITR
jgi:hypothetical protein